MAKTVYSTGKNSRMYAYHALRSGRSGIHYNSLFPVSQPSSYGPSHPNLCGNFDTAHNIYKIICAREKSAGSLACLFPLTREFARRVVSKRLERRLEVFSDLSGAILL